MTLDEFFKENPKAALGFSGGTDSCFLLAAAHRCGADVRPYYVRTPFQPKFEFEDAKKLCDEVGVALHVIEYDILKLPEVRTNGKDRCYHCKKAIFSQIALAARRDGYSLIIDGTNASDDIEDRPGMRAISELSVRSPLRECGITKSDVRSFSHQLGLFTWNKPSYACLATRIPTNTTISREMLQKIEHSENILADMGFSDFRLRTVSENIAKLQVTERQMQLVLNCRSDIIKKLSPYFENILLDLTVR